METVAKFRSSTEALDALDLLKARGISASICPDERTAGMWKGGDLHLVGYQLQVESDNFSAAKEALSQLGSDVAYEDEE